MITLRNIVIDDFLSHKQTTINLAPKSRVLIDGESGSGKSSIVDALIWCIYGVARTDSRALIRAGQNSAAVRVDFVVDPDFDGKSRMYSITRQVTMKGKHTIDVLMETDAGMVPIHATGTREIQRWIEHDFIGASYELFINSVVYPQGNQDSFVEASAARRKELLLEILSVDDIEMYYEKIRVGIKDAEDIIIGANAQLNMMDKVRQGLEASIAELPELEIDRSGRLYTVRKAEEEIGKLREEEAIHRENAVKYNVASDMIEKLKKEERGKDEEARGLHDEFRECANFVAGFDLDLIKRDFERVQEELSSLTKQHEERAAVLADRPSVFDYDSAIEDLERQLERMTKDVPECPSGDQCPFYRRSFPEIDYITNGIELKKKGREEQENKLAEWEKRLSEHPEPEGRQVLEERMEELSAILSKKERRDELKPRLEKARAGYAAVHEELLRQGQITNEYYQAAATVASIKAQITNAERALSAAKDGLSQLDTKIAIAEKASDDLKDLELQYKSTNEDVEKAQVLLDQLKELKEAFGANGIRAIAIDQLIPRFEDKINEVLGQMSNFRIRLDTQRKSVKGETTIEGLFITIRNEQGQEFDFNNYSGGERLKITVAISEALASMQRAGFRILDELFVGLDEASTESFAGVLGQIQSRFSQMLCISHLRQIKDLFDQRVVVTKINGVSATKDDD